VDPRLRGDDNVNNYNRIYRGGNTISQTVGLEAKVMFIKVVVENLDTAHDVTDITITATLGQD